MSMNFLIVDDSPIIRSMIEKTLKMAKIKLGNCFHASNGQEALETIETEWIDTIFLDVNMPVMNGIEVLERLNETGEIKSLRVIVVSTEGSATRIEDFKQLGIKGYLRKPFTPEQFQEELNKVAEVQQDAA